MTEYDKMKRVIDVFHEYIMGQSYFDIAFTMISNECLFFGEDDYVVMDTGEKLCEYILNEIRNDFFEEHNLPYDEELPFMLRSKLMNRMNVYMKELPEYQHLLNE